MKKKKLTGSGLVNLGDSLGGILHVSEVHVDKGPLVLKVRVSLASLPQHLQQLLLSSLRKALCFLHIDDLKQRGGSENKTSKIN